MYNVQKKQIAFLSDAEIEKFLTYCSEFFGTTLKKEATWSFIYLLRQKYNFVTDEKILDSCTNFASSQQQIKRFSPALLSHILITANQNQQNQYKTYEATEQEKAKYKQQWIEAVCLDFDDYCNNIPPTRIFIWRLLANNLKEKGLLTDEEYFATDAKESEAFSFHSEFKPLCINVFKTLAMQGKHISNYVY